MTTNRTAVLPAIRRQLGSHAEGRDAGSLAMPEAWTGFLSIG